MKVNVKYFASIREALAIAQEDVLVSGDTVGALRQALIERGGEYAVVLAPGRAVRMALNQVLAKEEALLSDGCEVAFFPPVTGG
jgi:molybdopterin synthase sulfur carrier subunit